MVSLQSCHLYDFKQNAMVITLQLPRENAPPCVTVWPTVRHLCHICAGTGPTTPLRRHWAHPCQICTGTGLAPATAGYFRDTRLMRDRRSRGGLPLPKVLCFSAYCALELLYAAYHDGSLVVWNIARALTL